jgi:hypothetical protein
MITGFCTYATNGRTPGCPRPPVCAPSGRWRPHVVRALPFAHPLDVSACMLSAPVFSTRLHVVLGSRPNSLAFPLAPMPVLVRAHTTCVDHHLRLPAATSSGNSKKNYRSKVN